MVLRIVLKDGNVRIYHDNTFTDYDLIGNAFVVMKEEQWVGIFNWDTVKEVLCMPEEEETKQ